MIVAPVATSFTRCKLNVVPGVSVVNNDTTTIQDMTSEPTSSAAIVTCSAKIQSSKLTTNRAYAAS
jgi:hypothetical protein